MIFFISWWMVVSLDTLVNLGEIRRFAVERQRKKKDTSIPKGNKQADTGLKARLRNDFLNAYIFPLNTFRNWPSKIDHRVLQKKKKKKFLVRKKEEEGKSYPFGSKGWWEEKERGR